MYKHLYLGAPVMSLQKPLTHHIHPTEFLRLVYLRQCGMKILSVLGHFVYNRGRGWRPHRRNQG